MSRIRIPINQPGFNGMSTGFFCGSNVLTKQDCLKSIVKSMTLEVKFQKKMLGKTVTRERERESYQFLNIFEPMGLM